MLNWHALTGREAAEYLASDPETGLEEDEAARRLEKHGANDPHTESSESFLKAMLRHICHPMSAVVFGAAVIAAVVAVNDKKGGNWLEPIMIFLLTLAICAVRGWRDYSAAATNESQRRLEVQTARVLRDGLADSIPARRIVPGDIIILEAGDIVPADARLLSATSLVCDESNAESGIERAVKSADTLTDATAPVDKRINMIYSGCPVLSGSCRAIVTATGASASSGRTAALLEGKEHERQEAARSVPVLSSDAMRMWSTGVTAVVCVCTLMMGLFRRTHDLKAVELIITGITLAYVALPTGVYSVLGSIFSRGSLTMAKQGVVMRRLSAIPVVGGTSVVCTGKTGLLTQGRMAVERVWTPGGKLLSVDDEKLGGEDERKLLEYAAVCSDESADAMGESIIASLEWLNITVDQLNLQYPRVARLPYGFGRRLMTTLHRTGNGILSVTKGAPDELVPLCAFCDEKAAMAVCEQMSRAALRPVAVAYRLHKKMPPELTEKALERDLVFAGIIGISDAERSDSAEAVEELAYAGVRVVMVSGEYPATAAACAERLGIMHPGDQMLTAGQLGQMSEKEINAHVRRCAVCARMSAEDECRVVEAWQAAGEVVLATAAKVEHLPIARKADASCSPGEIGQQSARMASDCVLTDNSFSLITDAIRLCRSTCDNARAAVRTLLAFSMGELGAVLLCVLLMGTTPLLAVHMLTAMLLGGAPLCGQLAYEPPDIEIMNRKPRRRKACIPMRETAVLSAVCGAIIASVTILAYVIGKPTHVDVGRTMAFGTLCLSQILCSVSLRSDQMLWFAGLRSNLRHTVPAALCMVGVMLVMLLGQEMLLLVDLTLGQWMITIGLSAASIVLYEVTKFLRPLIKQLGGLSEM